MARFEDVYRKNHRHQQFLVLGVSLLGLLLSVAPRQERALFITNGTGIKAFGVNLPLPPFSPASFLYSPQNLIDDFLPRAFFARTPRPGAPGGAGLPGDDSVPGGGPAAPFAPTDVSPDSVGGVPDTFSPATPGGGGGGGGSPFQFTPPALGGTSASPGAQVTPSVPTGATPGTPGAPGTPVTPGTPGTPGTPATPGTTDTLVPTVPAVPEPATWLLLLTGFLGVGATLRRRNTKRVRLVQAQS